jgi:hypothetical protein
MTSKQEAAVSRNHVPGEVEARLMAIIGATVPQVVEATGLDAKSAGAVVREIKLAGDGPYSPDTCARMMGMGYRTIYHLISTEQIRCKRLKDGGHFSQLYEISAEQLHKYVRERLSKDGERKARYLLFTGKGTDLAQLRSGLPSNKIEKILSELNSAGIGPKSGGPYNVKQAALVLMVKPRMVCRYCDEGRLFGRVDGELRDAFGFAKKYVITRKTLEKFAALDRVRGKPGQVNRSLEKKKARRCKKKSTSSP